MVGLMGDSCIFGQFCGHGGNHRFHNTFYTKERRIAIDASPENANIIISVKAFHEFCNAFPNAFLSTHIDSGESSHQLTAQSSMGGEFVFSLVMLHSCPNLFSIEKKALEGE